MDAFTIIGDPALNRVRFFAEAVRTAGATARVVSYGDILAGKEDLPALRAAGRIRIESPGRDFAVERQLLLRGARTGRDVAYSGLTVGELAGFVSDPGRILATRQWYAGFSGWLREMAATGASFLNSPDDIAVMFDKAASHARFRAAGVPVPEALPPPHSFEELLAAMDAAGWDRAFLKTSHGSGANGVVAFARSRGRMQATTALELGGTAGAPVLYSTNRLRTYRVPEEIRRLIGALCREPLHVEAWVPKAGLDGKTFDVRVVVIGGCACHLVLRLADGPITNLHLRAQKGGEDLLAARPGGAEAVALLRATAEQAARCFPQSLCMGVDLALAPAFQRVSVLEANAFGDLLEGVQWRGADTYTWEVRAALSRDWPPG